VLNGDEVKSIRAGKVSLTGTFATVHNGELYLINCNISAFSHAYNVRDADTTRRRKLLLKRKELNRLVGDISRKGITILPLKIYFNDRNYVKVELGIGKHRKSENKKQLLKERDIKRETSRELTGKYKM